MAKACIVVDCTGETCPIPLIETRKALNKAKPGEIVEMIGTHPASKKEIPMAVEALKLKLLRIEEKEGKWHIFIKK
ncbi:MAG: sulfurtransferase TusA family protein [Candidatus Altiarchaeota archaeon]|nr:sulfurtransferase TusA family protein [Candidatus Altiarchaeota archaeon]